MISKNSYYNRRLNKRKSPDISLTPLVDTALTLLVIFMITVPVMHNAIKVDLPTGQVQEAKDINKEVIVSIDKEGQLYINEDLVSWDELKESLQSRLPKGQNWVRVNGDKDISYGLLVKVVDMVKSMESIEHVALSTKKV